MGTARAVTALPSGTARPATQERVFYASTKSIGESCCPQPAGGTRRGAPCSFHTSPPGAAPGRSTRLRPPAGGKAVPSPGRSGQPAPQRPLPRRQPSPQSCSAVANQRPRAPPAGTPRSVSHAGPRPLRGGPTTTAAHSAPPTSASAARWLHAPAPPAPGVTYPSPGPSYRGPAHRPAR